MASIIFNIKKIKNAYFEQEELGYEPSSKKIKTSNRNNIVIDGEAEKLKQLMVSGSCKEGEHIPRCMKPLLLKNSKDDCFLNSTMNILMRVDGLREYFLNIPSETPCRISKELQLLFSRQVTNVSALRQLLSPKLRTGQQDVKDAFIEILEAAPSDAKNSLSILLETKLDCGSCDNHERTRTTAHEVLMFMKNTITPVNSIFDTKMSRRSCKVCGNPDARRAKKWLLTPTTTHLLLQVFKSERSQQIADLLDGTLELMGRKWKFSGFIEYLSNPDYVYGFKGHFVCWLSQPGQKWLRVSDNQKELHSGVDISMLDVSSVLLEIL